MICTQRNATSLRMSEIGYQSEAQKSLDIKYNSLEQLSSKDKACYHSSF